MYSYHKKEDERIPLTPEIIHNDQKLSVTGEMISCVIAFLYLAVVSGAAGACIWFLHSAEDPILSPLFISVPLGAAVLFIGCFFVYQVMVTVKVARYAYGHQYKVEIDILTKINEYEHDRVPFFSLDNLGKHSRRDKTVTAYYFEKHGRTSTMQTYLNSSDFIGDTFYVIVRKKDGMVMDTYNTKKYCLEGLEL
jgi:hypothetical protein